MTLVTTFVAFWRCDATWPPGRGTIVGVSTKHTVEMKAPARSADRISSCAILLAGVVGGVLVFVVALPLALSSPFPTPKQREWIIENSAQADASSFRDCQCFRSPWNRCGWTCR